MLSRGQSATVDGAVADGTVKIFRADPFLFPAAAPLNGPGLQLDEVGGYEVHLRELLLKTAAAPDDVQLVGVTAARGFCPEAATVSARWRP